MELTIHQLRSDIAVIGILRRLRDSGLGLASLQQLHLEWPRYGLRRGDLDRSVVRLESLGFVTVERLKGLQRLGLTPRGDRWAHSLRIWIERVLLLPRRVAQWFHRPIPRMAEAHPSRRLSDRLGRTIEPDRLHFGP
jgi:hypothetical protein